MSDPSLRELLAVGIIPRACDPDDLAAAVAAILRAQGVEPSFRMRLNDKDEMVAIEVWRGGELGVRVASFDCQPMKFGEVAVDTWLRPEVCSKCGFVAAWHPGHAKSPFKNGKLMVTIDGITRTVCDEFQP